MQHPAAKAGQHYPTPSLAPPVNPADALQQYQQERANTAATRQSLVRLYLGGMQNQRPTLSAN